MRFNIISFDLQGTLSDSAFCDEFWEDAVPRLYAACHSVTLESAQVLMKEEFQRMGEYDRRYHDVEYWLNELCPGVPLSAVLAKLQHAPLIFEDTFSLIEELHGRLPLIVVSAATRSFIEYELGERQRYFRRVFSSLDDFQVPGKTPQLYKEIASGLGVQPSTILHIGDHHELDVLNARTAGWMSFHFDRSMSRDAVLADLRQILFQ